MNRTTGLCRSTDNLSLADLKKQAKDLNRLTNTSNFDFLFDKNKKKYVPNLKSARSRSSSRESSRDGDSHMEISDTQELPNDGFIQPKNKRIRRSKPNDDTPDFNDINRFGILETADGDSGFIPISEATQPRKNNSKQTNTPSNSKNVQKDLSQTLPGTSQYAEINARPNVSKSKPRPPPIHVYNGNIKNTTNMIISEDVKEEDFWIRANKEYINITSLTLEVYNSIKKILDKNQLKYYTYTPRENKTKTLVLKGISADYSETDVLNHINNRKLLDTQVASVTRIPFDKTDPNRIFFLIQLAPESKTVALTRLKCLLNQPVKWERLRRKEVFQCRRCQRVGHASKNCTLDFRCVKCGGNHGPAKEGNECPVSKDQKLLKCVNCGSNEHPASYGKCPYLVLAHNVKSEAKNINQAIKKANVNRISRTINPNTSFANIVNNNKNNDFPPLQTPKQISFTGLNPTSSQYPTNTNPNYKQEFPQFEEILADFQNKMITVLKMELEKINQQVQENSKKIELLFSQFDE